MLLEVTKPKPTAAGKHQNDQTKTFFKSLELPSLI